MMYNVKWKFGAIGEPGDTISIGETINQLDKGLYSVFVTSVGQCVASKNFEIVPDILIFRGVSPNGDSKNDIFEISCIEDFPQNNVKIFNRAGTLVYQADGYNNNDIAFNGISNEGLSLMGRQLPDGTYFYIIDKKDGTRPKSGYLELLREQQ
jgi:large repetitive protein